MVLMSSRVRRPFKRAKSTVSVPFRTETGVLVPSESVRPVMSTRKPTTLGRGASVPVTKTELDCVVVLPEELALLPQPLSSAISASAQRHMNHFLRCICISPFCFGYSPEASRASPSRGANNPVNSGKLPHLTHLFTCTYGLNLSARMGLGRPLRGSADFLFATRLS